MTTSRGADRRRILGLLLPLLLGGTVAIVWVAVSGGPELAAALLHARPAPVILLIGATVVWTVVRFLRWQFMLRRAGVRIPIRSSVSTFVAGLAGTATPAYVGEIIRPILIRRRFGEPLGLTVPVWIAERVLDVVALALLLAVFTGSVRLRWVAGLALVGLGAVVVGGILWGRRRRWTGVAGMLRPRPLLLALGASVLAWAVAGLLPSLAAAAMGETLSLRGSQDVFSGSTLGGALTLMPAGVGATGSFAILGLEARGFSLQQAVSMVSLMRLGSTGLALTVGAAVLVRELAHREPGTTDAARHFDDISEEYETEFSTHVWDHLLARKMGMVFDAVGGPAEAGPGLDLGCGLGRQARFAREAGYRVVGVDPALRLLRAAERGGVPSVVADGGRLPFPDASFDWVYTIGVLHHVPGWEAQREVLAEVRRVLRGGGVFVIHETNPRNPLFRFYMGYLFPLLKKIDEGIEWWIPTERLGDLPGFEVRRIRYFTFIPDFVPAFLLRPALGLQGWLERSPMRRFSVHYEAELLRVSSDSGAPGPRATPHVVSS